MRVLRRVVFPIVWIVVFAIIAVALVKIAFLDGLKPSNALDAPQANIEPMLVNVTKGNIDNVVDVKASIRSDPSIPVLSTAAGEIVKVFVDPKAVVAEGDPLFQVRSEVQQQSTGQQNTGQPPADGKSSGEPAPPSKPVYKYTNVLAPGAGILDNFPVLLEQQLSVGQNVGSVSRQTLSVEGTLDTAQQYRLLSKPTTATVTVNNGPAPFECLSVEISAADVSNKSGSGSGAGSGGAGLGGMSVPMPMAVGYGPGPGPGGGSGSDSSSDAAVSGKVTCKVPAGVPVFAGLGAKVSLVAGSVKNVLTIPLTAVKGTFQSGQVWTNSAQGQEMRKVELGLSDGKMIEVKTGLAEGDQILQYVPGAQSEQGGCSPEGPCPAGPAGVVMGG